DRLPADEDDVAAAKREVPKIRLAPRREKDEATSGRASPGLELSPGSVARDGHGVEVVHAGALKPTVANAKARRLDYRRIDAETGAGPHDRPGVLGDVRLIESEKQRRARFSHDPRAFSAAPARAKAPQGEPGERPTAASFCGYGHPKQSMRK